MYILRQLDSSTLTGADIASEALTNDQRQQIVDVNPRYLLTLSGDGKFSSDYTQIAASGVFDVPLPQSYVTTNNLHLCLTSDQTIQVATTGANRNSTVMGRAGLNQGGGLTQCGPVTSITITNPQAVAANVEYFMFELPNVLSVAGWRDGALATGTTSP